MWQIDKLQPSYTHARKNDQYKLTINFKIKKPTSYVIIKKSFNLLLVQCQHWKFAGAEDNDSVWTLTVKGNTAMSTSISYIPLSLVLRSHWSKKITWFLFSVLIGRSIVTWLRAASWLVDMEIRGRVLGRVLSSVNESYYSCSLIWLYTDRGSTRMTMSYKARCNKS